MKKRFLEALGVAAVIVAVLVLLKLTQAPVTGQAGPAPRTQWNEPDLQAFGPTTSR